MLCRAGAAAGSPCTEAAPCPPALKVKGAEGERGRKPNPTRVRGPEPRYLRSAELSRDAPRPLPHDDGGPSAPPPRRDAPTSPPPSPPPSPPHPSSDLPVPSRYFPRGRHEGKADRSPSVPRGLRGTLRQALVRTEVFAGPELPLPRRVRAGPSAAGWGERRSAAGAGEQQPAPFPGGQDGEEP